MKFDVKKDGQATILTLHSRKLDAELTPQLKAEFLLLGKPKAGKKLIIDLAEVQFCDSSGLSALLIADRTMRAHEGTVHLVNVHKKVMDLLKLSQLDRIFTIDSSVDEALQK